MWNTGKQIATMVALAFVVMGIPLLTVRGIGIHDKSYVMGLTYQELTGIVSFLVLMIGMFSYWRISMYLNKRKNNS